MIGGKAWAVTTWPMEVWELEPLCNLCARGSTGALCHSSASGLEGPLLTSFFSLDTTVANTTGSHCSLASILHLFRDRGQVWDR